MFQRSVLFGEELCPLQPVLWLVQLAQYWNTRWTRLAVLEAKCCFIVWVAGWNLDIKELFSDRRPPLSQLWHHLILHLQESVDSFVSECRTNSFQVWPFCWSSALRSLVFLLVFNAVLAIPLDFCLSHVKHMVLSPVSFFQSADKLLVYGLWPQALAVCCFQVLLQQKGV